MADEKLEILITADDKASGVLRGLSGAVGGMASFLGTALVAGATAAITAIGAFGVAAISAAGRVEEMSVVLDVLARNAGMSSESVQAAALSIKGMGIETASAQEITALFIQNQLDLSKSTDLARVAQDAAVISGKNSTETTLGLINGIVTLQTEVLRSNGITLDLAAAYDTYAESVGKTAADLTTAEKQQAALNAVIDAGSRISGAYEAAMEKAGKQIRSWPRYLNDILVSAGGPFQDAFDTSATAVSGFLKEIGKGFAEGGAFAPIMEKLGALALTLAENFSSWLGSVDLDAIAGKIGSVVDGITGFISSLSSGEGTFGSMFSAFSALMPILSGVGGILLQSFLPAISQIATMLSPLISTFVPQLVEMFGSLAVILVGSLLPPFMELIQAILPPLMELITPLIDLFGQLVVALMPIVEVILGALADLITRVMEALMPVINAILPVLVELFITVADAIAPLLDAILPPLIDIVMMLINAILPLVSAILPLLANLFQVVILAIAPLLEAILPVLVKLIELLLTALNPVIEIALPAFAKLVEGLSDSIERYILPALRNFSEWMSEHVTPAINGIISAIQSAIDWVKEMAASLSNITLPDWLTPGSPTPFEMGLRGIASALKDVNDIAFPTLGGVTAPFTGDSAFSPAGRSASASSGPTIVLQYSPTFSFASEVEAREKLLPFVQEGIRRAKQDGLL